MFPSLFGLCWIVPNFVQGFGSFSVAAPVFLALGLEFHRVQGRILMVGGLPPTVLRSPGLG